MLGVMDDDFVGVKAALFLGDKLIVFLRDNKPGLRFANLWDFPGGGREGNETPFETLEREVKEEFGIQLMQDSVIWQKEYPAMHDSSLRAYFMAANISQVQADSIVFGEEGQKWTLMTVREFLSRDDVVPHLKGRLTDYLNEGQRT